MPAARFSRDAASPRIPFSQIAAFIARDPYIHAQAVISAIVAAFYIFPLVSHDALSYFSGYWLCVPFMIVPVVGAAAGIGALPLNEQRAWRIIFIGLCCWLGALVLAGLWPEKMFNEIENSVLTCIYLAYYLCILLAIDAMPRDGTPGDESTLEHRIRQYGVVVFVAGWVIYLVVLPGFFQQRFTGEHTGDAPASIVLGLATVARALVWRYQSISPRWRAIALAVAVACFTLVVTDSLNLLLAMDVLKLNDGAWTDAFWAVPSFALLGAIRLRHAPLPAGGPVVSPDPDALARTPIGLGVYLLCGGLSFPLAHWLLGLLGVVTYRGWFAGAFVDITVIMLAAAMTALAVAAIWRLEASRAEVRRAHRKLQEDLDRANKMEALGRLAGGVAHDFNNILTVIGGTAELAMRNTSADHPNRDLLEQCREAANRAAALTRQLLVFSRRQVAETVVLDPNELIASMSALLQQLIGEQIRVSLHLQPAVYRVRINRGHLEQILLNLAANARDAMPHGGALDITTTNVVSPDSRAASDDAMAPGEYVKISVRDTGFGIAPDAKTHIFEPFFTTKSDDGSRGIGLATVYGIVKQHGGDIAVESTTGHGTNFTFHLPASHEPLATMDPAQQTGAPGSGETLLVVEDNAEVRRIVHSFLTSRHYRVLEAVSGLDALDRFGDALSSIDLVLTDVVMPEMSGVELVRELHRRRPKIRVLYMSGYPDEDLVRQGLSAHMVDFIQKPFAMDALAHRVRRALDTPND